MNQKLRRLSYPASIHCIAVSSALGVVLGCSEADATRVSPEAAEVPELPIYTGSGVVSTGGAIVTTEAGRVVIPRGALAAPVEIAVEIADSGFPPFSSAAREQIVAFLPHGTQFRLPVTVEIAHPHGGGADLGLYTAEPRAPWSLVPDASFTETSASARVTHFSYFFASDAAPTQPPIGG